GGDNDGTLIGDQLRWTAGRSAGALSFPGEPIDARVEFPTTGMSATAGTVAMWGYLFDPQPKTDGRYFFGHTTHPQWANRVQIYMQEGSTPSTLLGIGLGNSHTRDTDIMELPLEEWLHVALTWDSGNYVVYVNGEEVSSGNYTGLSVIHPVANIGNDGRPESIDARSVLTQLLLSLFIPNQPPSRQGKSLDYEWVSILDVVVLKAPTN
ncbi:unnamed protein product, partial [marine sediment metagenome]